jgi:GT2 family glycosyltransferase
MEEVRPSLSIVVASYNARDTIVGCLESLRRQQARQPFEVLVVDSSTDGTGELVAQRFPEVVLLRRQHRLFPGDARNLGIAAARAPVIAFLDADCTVDGDWVDGVLAAQAAGHPLVASAIDNGSRESLLGWTYYFCEFNLWLPARQERSIPEGAACCISFAREVFDRYGPFLEGTYCSDTVFCWKVRQSGQRLHFDPGIRVCHHVAETLPSMLRHIFSHRRTFARVTRAMRNLTSAGVLRELVLLPATPALLMGAVFLRLRRCPSYVPIYLVVSPLVFMGFLARVLGEAAGYLGPEARP